MLQIIDKIFKIIESVAKWFLIISLSIILILVAHQITIPSTINSNIIKGMSKHEVLDIVGRAPDFENTVPDVCWFRGCDDIMASGSSKYLIWSFGIDTILVVGFDENGTVIFHGIGDT